MVESAVEEGARLPAAGRRDLQTNGMSQKGLYTGRGSPTKRGNAGISGGLWAGPSKCLRSI